MLRLLARIALEGNFLVEWNGGLNDGRQRFGTLDDIGVNRQPLVSAKACTRRNQAAHDDVFLESTQEVDLAANSSFGEHLGGLLEGRGRDEALGRERRLGDTEQERLGLGGTA